MSLFLLVIPSIIYVLLNLLKKNSIFSFPIALKFFLYNVLIISSFLMFDSYLNIEEFLLLSFVLAVIILIPLKKICFLDKMTLIIVFCVIYSMFTYGRAHIHSDTATASLLVKSIIKSKSIFPKSWNYANGEIWLLNLLPENFIPYILLSDKSLARTIGSFASVLITIVTIFLFSKRFFKNESYQLSIAIVFTCLIGATLSLSGEGIPLSLDMILYQAAYVRQFSICLIYIYLFEELLLCKFDNKKAILMFILLFLIFISGIRNLAELIFPSILAMIVFYLLNTEELDKNGIKKVLKLLIIIFVSVIFGLLVYRWLCSCHYMNSREINGLYFSSSLELVIDNIKYALINIYDCFGFYSGINIISIKGIMNIILLSLCTLFCFILPIVQIINIKKESKDIQLFTLYVVLHNFILFLTIVLFDKTESSHYLLTSVFLSVILSCRYLYNSFFIIKFKQIYISIFICIFSISSLNLLLYSRNWKTELNKKKEIAKTIVDLGVDKLYGRFWDSYIFEVYSDMKFEAAGVDIHLNVDTGERIPIARTISWLNDQDVFISSDNCKTAVIIKDFDSNVYGIKNDDIISLFGQYEKNVDIDNYRIFLFNHDIISDVGNGLDDKRISPKEFMFVTKGGGEIKKEEILIFPQGCMYGPYIEMGPGDYTLSVNGYSLENCQFGINSFTDNNSIYYEVVSKDNDNIECKLHIDDVVKNVEFLLYNNSAQDAYFYYLEIEQQSNSLIKKFFN